MSRIERFEVARVRVSDRTTWTLVRLTTSRGEKGLGECSDGGTDQELSSVLEAAAAAVLGSDISSPPPALAGGRGLAATTVAGALELAALDILGRREGVPIWKLLGGVETGPVELYANINRAAGTRSPAAFAATAAAAVKDGFRALKCAPFDRPSDQGVDIVEAIRKAVGPDIRLMVDLHHRLTPEQLQELLPELERLDVAWLEDAVRLDQPDQLRELRRRTAIPVAGGEMCSDPAQLRPSLGEEGLQIVLPDVKHAGGLRRARELATLAAEHGAGVSPHNPTSPVATAASLHLAALVPNLLNLEFAYGEAQWRSRATDPPERPRDGRLTLPARPGLGITVNPDLIEFKPIGGER